MASLRKFKKYNFYLLSSLLALVASYIVVENSHNIEVLSSDSNIVLPYAHADVPVAAAPTGDDGGDGGG